MLNTELKTMDVFSRVASTFIDLGFEGYYVEGLIMQFNTVNEHAWIEINGQILEAVLDLTDEDPKYFPIQWWDGSKLLNDLYYTQGALPMFKQDALLYQKMQIESYRIIIQYDVTASFRFIEHNY